VLKKKIYGGLTALAIGASLLAASPAQAAGYPETWTSTGYELKQSCQNAVLWKAQELRLKGYQATGLGCVKEASGIWFGKVSYRTP